MNNFRNPYVDPDSFQGKIYDNYRNHTTPQSIQNFSLSNQEKFEQKETQQNQKSNQYGKTKKHTIYINHQLEKINDSKLVMFSPPKVDSIQKPLNEDPIDELAFNIAQSKHPENEKKDKEEIVSTLVKEFSLMLEDNSSIQEDKDKDETIFISDKSTSINENKSLDEFTNNANNESTTEHRVHTKHDNSEMLLAEFHSMLDEGNDDLLSKGEDIKLLSETNDNIDDNFLLMFLGRSEELQEENQNNNTNEEDIDTLKEPTNPMEEKYLTMLSESDELQEGNLAIHMNEEDIDELDEPTDDRMEEKFFTMLSESDELPEKNQVSHMNEEAIDKLKEPTDTIEDEYITMLSESDELPEENQDSHMSEKAADELKEPTDAIEDEYLTMLTESDGVQKEYGDSLFTTLKGTKPDKTEDLSNLKDPHFISYVEKKKTTTVKMQVLLARLEIDIDIVETMDLVMPLENIVRVELSIQSLDCRVVIPSKKVFLKGEFIAEIEFSNEGLENRIQSMKVSIPWSKTANINWLSVPEYSHSNQYEYMFQSPSESTSNIHYKSHHEFAEPINSQLNQINFVWHQELNPNNQQLQINGLAQLSINFLQEQLVELDCYSK
ncbi:MULTISPECIES: hypothetical protein [Solibacillus]|uniref:Uncharacterized protein n=1 Tax=Solibacillus merdavium TaxID=2762218 RepID=A0ABR8XRB1_9BACL|nr:hypothetical protein [Solibacillus merdavium]MBD8034451.1 hypothetical protein [Solibacillus merdavium]